MNAIGIRPGHVFTTHANVGGRPSATAVRKAILIARDAVVARMPHSTSRGSRYVAENSYDDKAHFLSCSLVRARANYGWVNYACDRERFEIRVFSGQMRTRKPVVVVRERHPIGSAAPRLDRQEIVAVLDRWLSMLRDDEESPHEGWSRASRYVAALALQNGAVPDLPERNEVVLPSAYAPGRIRIDWKLRNHPNAKKGMDLDLSVDGEIARITASLCHASRLETKLYDYRGDTRIVCDLSGEVALKMTVPDTMAALRAMADAEAHAGSDGRTDAEIDDTLGMAA
jgi:hypothetical protein